MCTRLYRLQTSALSVVCFVILGGCTRDRFPDLKLLASGLEQPWPGSREASMTMTVRDSGGHPVLHCRLQNSSEHAIALNRSQLPWKTPLFFGTLVTSTGRTFAIGPGVMAYIMGEPHPFFLAPGEVVEGEFELKYLPGRLTVGPPIPRDEDTLLLWSYGLGSYGETLPRDASKYDARQMQIVRLVGITFLPKQAMKLLHQ